MGDDRRLKEMNGRLLPLTEVWPEGLRGMEDSKFPGRVELVFTVESKHPVLDEECCTWPCTFIQPMAFHEIEDDRTHGGIAARPEPFDQALRADDQFDGSTQ